MACAVCGHNHKVNDCPNCPSDSDRVPFLASVGSFDGTATALKEELNAADHERMFIVRRDWQKIRNSCAAGLAALALLSVAAMLLFVTGVGWNWLALKFAAAATAVAGALLLYGAALSVLDASQKRYRWSWKEGDDIG